MITKDQAIAVAVLAGTVIAVYVLWKAKEGAAAVVETARGVVTQDLNPASDRNLIYRGVNAVGGAIAGEDDWSLGSAIYDWLHPE